MIKKLRAKLILACMFSLAVVLLVILGGVNLMSYQKVVSDADTVLSLLAANDGAFPKLRAPQEEKDEGYFSPFGTPGGKPNLFNQRIMSPETPYESRFFSVLLGEDGQAVETDTGQIAAVDAEQATDYAQKAAASGKTSGFLDDYRFLVQNESGGIRVIFLDCGRSLSSFRTTLLASAAWGLSKGYLRKGPIEIAKSGLDREVLAGNVVHIQDVATDPPLQYPEAARAEGLVSILVLPLLVDGKAIGSLRVYSAVARNFTEEEVEFAGAIANLSAIAIENARMHQALKTDYELLTAYNNTIHEL